MKKSSRSNAGLVLEQARVIHETIGLLRRHAAMRRPQHTPGRGHASLCHELTLAQMNTVRVVRDLDKVTIKQLAKSLCVSSPSASTTVDRLVELGILLREQSREDRREVIVRVSPKVMPEIEAAEKDFLQWIVELLQQLGPEYAGKWSDVYARLRVLLHSEPHVRET